MTNLKGEVARATAQALNLYRDFQWVLPRASRRIGGGMVPP
jgi:hypothetical protein